MDEKEKKELAVSLKGKRYRKYILTARAVFICVSAVAGLSIEGKDAKLPDGQGNIVAGQQDDSSSDADKQAEALSQLTDEEKEKTTLPM